MLGSVQQRMGRCNLALNAWEESDMAVPWAGFPSCSMPYGRGAALGPSMRSEAVKGTQINEGHSIKSCTVSICQQPSCCPAFVL